jgi:hypothetical protein
MIGLALRFALTHWKLIALAVVAAGSLYWAYDKGRDAATEKAAAQAAQLELSSQREAYRLADLAHKAEISERESIIATRDAALAAATADATTRATTIQQLETEISTYEDELAAAAAAAKAQNHPVPDCTLDRRDIERMQRIAPK